MAINIANLAAEIEFDRTWRAEELLFLERALTTFSSEEDRGRYRKSLVVMLYSHFEGFCKTALLTYLKAINLMELDCHTVNDALAAAALAPLFKIVTDGGKHPFFKHDFPEDAELHLLSRRIQFLSGLHDVLKTRVELDDALINTESNLKTVVLKKNLYQLGLDESTIAAHRSAIDRLVHLRNAIAHGDKRNGPDANDYQVLRTTIDQVMDTVTSMLLTAAASQLYLRPDARLPIRYALARQSTPSDA